MTDSSSTQTQDLTVTRTFDAPLARVWDAWRRSEDVQRWWGPSGWTCPVANMDFREGGTTLVCMRSPDGHDMYNTWTYSAIVPQQSIEYTVRFSDQEGKALEPSALGLPPGIPAVVPHRVTLEATGERQTRVTVREFGYTSEQVVEMSRMGLEQCLDKMETLVTTS